MAMATQRDWMQRVGRGRWSGLPLKNHKNIGFHSKTDPDSLKSRKAAKQAFNVGHHRHISETPFKWCFAGGR